MLYCDLNVSFHQCIKSYPNIQVPYPNIQISYPDIEMSYDVKMIYHENVMHFVII